MLNWLRKFFNNVKTLLFGRRADTPTDISTDTTPASPTAQTAEAKAEPRTHREIDWENDPPEYRKRKNFMSFREREFYRALRSQVDKKYHIFSMVRMADVVRLANETKDRKFFNNQILCKHFDFVLCDTLYFEPVLVIELDDNRHHWQHRWEDDQFKNKACEMAGIPLIRFEVKQDYDRAEIRQKIEAELAKIPEIS
jgi:hypothetical protein